MRLFGEQGYAATSVAQIEKAAGLTPGAGGLYAHFPSKKAVLEAGLTAILSPADDLLAQLAPAPASGAERDEAEHEAGHDAVEPGGLDDDSDREGIGVSARLEAVARAGLARLRHDRDFNRILVRDLRDVPELLEMAAERELRPVHEQLADLIARFPAGREDDVDARAVAAVLIAATSHYWLMTDVFGQHPAGVSENEFIGALVQLATALLTKEARS